MRTLKSSFKYTWLIAASLALFSCAQSYVDRDASAENGASAERSQQWHGYPHRSAYGHGDRGRSGYGYRHRYGYGYRH